MTNLRFDMYRRFFAQIRHAALKCLGMAPWSYSLFVPWFPGGGGHGTQAQDACTFLPPCDISTCLPAGCAFLPPCDTSTRLPAGNSSEDKNAEVVDTFKDENGGVPSYMIHIWAGSPSDFADCPAAMCD